MLNRARIVVQSTTAGKKEGDTTYPRNIINWKNHILAPPLPAATLVGGDDLALTSAKNSNALG